MASPAFPEPPPLVPNTPFADAEALLGRLVAKKDAWVNVPIARRVELLRACIGGVLEVADAWVEAACRAKGITAEDNLAGEEWLGGPMVTVRNLRLLADALEANAAPKLLKVTTNADGQQRVKVFPNGLVESLMYAGYTGEVWLERGQPASQGQIYRAKEAGQPHPGKVALVLGAGNVASIGPTDALTKLFVEDEVVLLKSNPVNAYVGPFLERAFKPLVDEGVFGVVYGGAEIGGFLCHHPKVDTIHITGSDRTHDAIVWGGSPDEQARRKAAHEPVLHKPITSELGCVTPVIVVPGPWSDSDMAFQARQVAGMVTNNGSFNCNAAKVLVMAKGWPQREAFLQKVEAALRTVPPRKAYYPGAESRYSAFLSHYPQAKPLGEKHPGVVPWTLIEEIPQDAGEYGLSNEAFCGVLTTVSLDATTAADFMDKAVRFANDKVWGTLSVMVLIHPASEQEANLEKAVADLRYGGIAINCWAGVIFGSVALTWGAFPGHPLEDIRSGRGTVHNTFLLDHPEKSVLKAPFRASPLPVWFSGHRTLRQTSRALTFFEAKGSLWGLPSVLRWALRG